jgi:hypothetical protein
MGSKFLSLLWLQAKRKTTQPEVQDKIEITISKHSREQQYAICPVAATKILAFFVVCSFPQFFKVSFKPVELWLKIKR